MPAIDLTVAILVATITAATPLLFAALGEMISEKSGVLNLGVEGMMVVGAVTGFAVTVSFGNPVIGIIAAVLASAGMALLFAVLTLSLLANQVATGLALTIFGIGLSSLIGRSYVGTPLPALPKLAIPGLSELPVIGPLIFGHDALIYLSVAMVVATAWFLNRTRPGLILRAVGESHDAAHAIGYSVIGIRYLAVLFGGAMAGLAGAYLSLAYTPLWIENMTAGRGWIALALVVFSSWKPTRVLMGAYLFGGVTILQFHAQNLESFQVPSQVLSMLPYLATILVLVLISYDATRIRLNAPACLGKIFHPNG